MTNERHENDFETADEPYVPEPPVRYDPQKVENPLPEPDEGQNPQVSSIPQSIQQQLVSASRFILAGAIAGPFSLMLGGALLSSIGLILAVIGYRKAAAATAHADGDSLRTLIRYGKVAIGVCVLTLVINVIFAVFLYPTIYESLVSGDTSSIFGNGSASSGSTGSSTWG